MDQAFKLRELRNKPVPESGKGKIISVTSGKGGTGKSFVSFNLALAFSRKGNKTLLVEFDHNLSSLSYQLGVEPETTIYDVFRGTALFEDLPCKISENLFVAFGENGKLNYPENLVTHIKNFFARLYGKTNDYDYIIIDNGAGISPEIFETIRHSSMNLIVTQPDAVSVMDAYVLIKLMKKNSLNIPVGISINKCGNIEQGKEAFENLNKATDHFFGEKVELCGILPEDRKAAELMISVTGGFGELMKTNFFGKIEEVADGIHNFRQLANIHH